MLIPLEKNVEKLVKLLLQLIKFDSKDHLVLRTCIMTLFNHYGGGFIMKLGGKGGSHTNQTGLPFEKRSNLADNLKTDLSEQYSLIPYQFNDSSNKSKALTYNVIRLADKTRVGIIAQKHQFYRVLDQEFSMYNVNHKEWQPDEAFINLENKTVYIVEKKWQQTSGSVDEKIFGFVNKRRLYQEIFNQQQIDEPKIAVEFAAMFNSSYWIYAMSKAEISAAPDENMFTNKRKQNNHYQDYFNNLRIDGIKIFFDVYDYSWFGL